MGFLSGSVLSVDKSIARIDLAFGSSVSAGYPEGFNPIGNETGARVGIQFEKNGPHVLRD
jgi:hypothetical protein